MWRAVWKYSLAELLDSDRGHRNLVTFGSVIYVFSILSPFTRVNVNVPIDSFLRVTFAIYFALVTVASRLKNVSFRSSATAMIGGMIIVGLYRIMFFRVEGQDVLVLILATPLPYMPPISYFLLGERIGRVVSSAAFCWLLVLFFLFPPEDPSDTIHYWRIRVLLGQLTSVALTVVGATRIFRLMEEKDNDIKARRETLSAVSHELRTPLNGIIGMNAMLSHTPLNEQQAMCANVIGASATYLLRMVNDILDVAKAEAGMMKTEKLAFSPVAWMDALVATIALQAQEKGLELLVEIDPALPEKVSGDPNRMNQVLLNIVGNAIKFTSVGFVLLRLSVASVTRQGATQTVVLRIDCEDSGLGIPEEKRQRVFEPFRQADETIVRRFGGTGLGMSISKHLVELMGGTIGFSSVSAEPRTDAETADNAAGGAVNLQELADRAANKHRGGGTPGATPGAGGSYSRNTVARSADTSQESLFGLRQRRNVSAGSSQGGGMGDSPRTPRTPRSDTSNTGGSNTNESRPDGFDSAPGTSSAEALGPPSGTKFFFTVSLTTDFDTATLRSALFFDDFSDLKILIVDSNPVVIENLRHHLGHWRCEPTAAYTLQEAVSVLRHAAAEKTPFMGVILGLVPDATSHGAARAVLQSVVEPGFEASVESNSSLQRSANRRMRDRAPGHGGSPTRDRPSRRGRRRRGRRLSATWGPDDIHTREDPQAVSMKDLVRDDAASEKGEGSAEGYSRSHSSSEDSHDPPPQITTIIGVVDPPKHIYTRLICLMSYPDTIAEVEVADGSSPRLLKPIQVSALYTELCAIRENRPLPMRVPRITRSASSHSLHSMSGMRVTAIHNEPATDAHARPTGQFLTVESRPPLPVLVPPIVLTGVVRSTSLPSAHTQGSSTARSLAVPTSPRQSSARGDASGRRSPLEETLGSPHTEDPSTADAMGTSPATTSVHGGGSSSARGGSSAPAESLQNSLQGSSAGASSAEEAARLTQSSTTHTMSTSTTSGPPRVLVVDDQEVNLIVAECMLLQYNLSVVLARDGKEAVELFKSAGAEGSLRFEVVLLDCQLGADSMDGMEVARAMRAHEAQHRWPRCAIIAATGEAGAEMEARCLAAGMDDVLVKPYEPETLAAKLRKSSNLDLTATSAST